MIGSFGWMELLLILFIVLIIFGAGKIPQLGEGLGKAIKGFKKSIHEPDAMDITPSPEQEEPQQGVPMQPQQVSEQIVEQANVPTPPAQPVHQAPEVQPQETRQG